MDDSYSGIVRGYLIIVRCHNEVGNTVPRVGK